MTMFLLQLISAILGCLLGGSGLLGFLFFIQKRRVQLSETLLLEYKAIAKELAIVLDELLPLSLYPHYYSQEKCKEIDKALSKFFFQYYLVLPQEVLEEINCMHACLIDKENRLYIVDKNESIPTLRPRVTADEIVSLLDEVALVKRERSLSEIYLEYNKLPRYVYLKCQARHVITILSKSWNMRDLYEWSKNLNKHTIAEIKNSRKSLHISRNGYRKTI